jgi:hypothetical protein
METNKKLVLLSGEKAEKYLVALKTLSVRAYSMSRLGIVETNPITTILMPRQSRADRDQGCVHSVQRNV